MPEVSIFTVASPDDIYRWVIILIQREIQADWLAGNQAGPEKSTKAQGELIIEQLKKSYSQGVGSSNEDLIPAAI